MLGLSTKLADSKTPQPFSKRLWDVVKAQTSPLLPLAMVECVGLCLYLKMSNFNGMEQLADASESLQKLLKIQNEIVDELWVVPFVFFVSLFVLCFFLCFFCLFVLFVCFVCLFFFSLFPFLPHPPTPACLCRNGRTLPTKTSLEGNRSCPHVQKGWNLLRQSFKFLRF